jgi:FixJ family two-component response regulator
MPRLNGINLYAHLVEERPEIKVFVMSGAAIREIVNKNVNLPFLPKPFEGQTLKREFEKSWPLQFSRRKIFLPQTRIGRKS